MLFLVHMTTPSECGIYFRVFRPCYPYSTKALYCPLPCPDRIVSGSAAKTVRVWDVLSGTQVLLLQGHIDVISAVAFSPDGTRIVSG